MIHVALINHTPEPERLVAASAKLCYANVGVEELSESMDDAAVIRFIDLLMDLGHESPLEHVSFTFAIEGVSRVLTHQLVRHRIASYSQQSQRYVSLDSFEYVVPPAVRDNPEALRLFEASMEADRQAYGQIASLLEADHRERLQAEGWPEKEAVKRAKKAAIEDARFVFPNACETKIVATMNARSLMNFFRHRTCNRAQWEIRELSIEMLRLVRGVAPHLFRTAGPGCLLGPCPEGAMTCGKSQEVRAFFERMEETDER